MKRPSHNPTALPAALPATLPASELQRVNGGFISTDLEVSYINTDLDVSLKQHRR